MRRLRRWFLSDAGALAHVFGTFLCVVAAMMLVPLAAALYFSDGDAGALGATAAGMLVLGAPLRWLFRPSATLGPRHAFVIATVGWVVISALSAIPFVVHGAIPSYTDAFFEMMSGYTTTGATILDDIEALPRGLSLWRSTTHLIGGMGFVTLAVLVLPHGLGGLNLFRAESSPGQMITGERVSARTRDTVRQLWTIYLALNAALILILWGCGMTLYDATCHAFGTLSTGGYSPKAASVGHYDSAAIDYIITFFMFLGGVAFTLFLQMWRNGTRDLRNNTEFRWYTIVVVGGSLLIAAVLWTHGTYGALDALRYGAFQFVALLTTTGFGTADYEQWPNAAQSLLWVASFVGASAGSTSSGIKIVHFIIVISFATSVVKKLFFQPLAVVSVRLDGKRVGNDALHLAMCYFVFNTLLVLIGAVVFTFVEDLDMLSAVSTMVASLMNIGPGFGAIGPSHSFAFFSDTAKWLICLAMLVGRLELFSAFVLLYPSFWRG